MLEDLNCKKITYYYIFNEYKRKINKEVFVQTLYSDYESRIYKFKKFSDMDKFSDILSNCDKIINHGGISAIIGTVKKKRR